MYLILLCLDPVSKAKLKQNFRDFIVIFTFPLNKVRPVSYLMVNIEILKEKSNLRVIEKVLERYDYNLLFYNFNK